MVQAFSEERHLRRDGVELLGYETDRAGQRHRDLESRSVGRRQYPVPDRRRALRAGAQAHGRPDRHRVPADRRPEARPPVLHVGPGRDELQPQLPALGTTTFFGSGRGHRRRIRATSSGTTRSSQANFAPVPGTPLVPESTTRSRARTKRPRRTTAASRPATRFSDAFDALRPDRHLGGPRRDTDAGRVRDASGSRHRRGYQLQWHRQRAGFQLRHRRHLDAVPGRHSGRLRLDLRRPGRGRRGRGRLGPDRRRLRRRRRRLDRPAVRRALQRARARVAQRHRPGPARPAPWTPRTIRRRSRTIRPTSTPSAGRSRRTSGSGRRRSWRHYNGPPDS